MTLQNVATNYGFDEKLKSTIATMLISASSFGGVNTLTKMIPNYTPNQLNMKTFNDNGKISYSSDDFELASLLKNEYTDAFVYFYGAGVNQRLYTNLRKINRFRNFEDNWNGNNASKFSESLLNHVQNIILKLDHQPEIFPVADNSIQLEYDHGDDYLEIQIYDSSASVYEEKNGSETEFQTANDALSINKIVDSFYG